MGSWRSQQSIKLDNLSNTRLLFIARTQVRKIWWTRELGLVFCRNEARLKALGAGQCLAMDSCGRSTTGSGGKSLKRGWVGWRAVRLHHLKETNWEQLRISDSRQDLRLREQSSSDVSCTRRARGNHLTDYSFHRSNLQPRCSGQQSTGTRLGEGGGRLHTNFPTRFSDLVCVEWQSALETRLVSCLARIGRRIMASRGLDVLPKLTDERVTLGLRGSLQQCLLWSVLNMWTHWL